MRVFVLGSGSSGNCLVVEAEGERILVDAGIGPTLACERMRALGASLITSKAPLGIFVTHEHGDHAAHASPLARALKAPLYAHDATPLGRVRRKLEVRTYTPGRATPLGPFLVEAIAVPHDAPHVALRVSVGRRRFGLATDLGHATRDVRAFLAGCDTVLLEANYCPGLLEAGPYPPRLKQRVMGPIGHLANEQAAELARQLEDGRVSRLALIHLSRSNNSPERALAAVASRVRRLPVEAVPHGEARRIDVPESSGMAGAEQLGFTFG